MSAILSQALNPKELSELNRFLSIVHSDPLGTQLTEMHGFLTAVISAPHLIMPSVWQSLILEEAAFFSSPHAAHIVHLLMRLNNTISDTLYRGERLEPLLFVRNKTVSLKEADVPIVSAWCRGYLIGANLDPLWSSEEEARKHLLPFSIFAVADLSTKSKDDPEWYANIQHWEKQEKDNLPDQVRYFFDYWSKEREKAIPLPNMQTIPQEKEQKTQEETPEARLKEEQKGRSLYEKVAPQLSGPLLLMCPCGSQRERNVCCGGPEDVFH